MNEESLFAAAREMPSPGEQEVFLSEMCGSDTPLRLRLEQLLSADRNAQGILERGALTVTFLKACSAEPLEAEQLFADRFRLIEKIGEGGMGEVWVAEQLEPVQRRVALKVIRTGLDSATLLGRFDQERQTLALMDHPNIARVIDAGAAGGRPYFVMDLIHGMPITKYCDDARLSTRQRLELFIPVCLAVQHAHQKGIIHRDLKPTNILVCEIDGKPVPKVIDFGIAKATQQRPLGHNVSTEIGMLVGTLEYMSPEQSDLNGLDVDTRSDIYSLGVVLYELLTGGVPFPHEQLRAVPFTEMLRIIKEVEPPKPSLRLVESQTAAESATARNSEPRTLAALIRGELDWIVMKCLEKDRDRRYETANGLAADLQRYLADEPVIACPMSAGYRLRKFARKNKKVLATVSVFAALLMAATVTSIGLASWAIRERDHADQQKQAAEANFKKALDAVDQMLTRVAEVHLLHVPQMEPIRRDLLKAALRFYQEFLREKGDSPQVRSEAASAYRRVGQIEVLLGNRNEGEVAFRQGEVLLEKLLSESPDDPDFGNQLAGIHNDLGKLYHTTERWSQAEASLKQADARLEQLVGRHSARLKNHYDLAKNRDGLANLYRQMGRRAEAEAAYLKSVTLLDGLLTGDAQNVEYLTLLAGCHLNGALLYHAQDRTTESVATGLKAVALNQQLVDRYPEAVHHQKKLAQTLNNLGLFYSRDRKHDKAEALYQQSLTINETLLRNHLTVVSFKVDVGGSYSNMATHVRRYRSPEESLEWSEHAIRTLDAVLEKGAPDVLARAFLFDALQGRALALLQMERPEDAAKDWQRMIEVSEGQTHINMRLHRPSTLARLGKHVQATAEVETLLAASQVKGLDLYIFAYVHSLCSAVAASDVLLPPTEQEKLADKYGSRAVELLRKAQAEGYFQDPKRLVRMKEDGNLDAIRSRPDFQQLLVELEKKQRPNP